MRAGSAAMAMAVLTSTAEAPCSSAAAAWLVHALVTETDGDVQVAEDGGVLLFGATIGA